MFASSKCPRTNQKRQSAIVSRTASSELGEGVESRAQVRMVGVELRQPHDGVAAGELRLRALGQLEVEGGVPCLELVAIAGLRSTGRELAECAQEQKAALADRLDEARVDERGQRVEVGVGDLFGRVEVEGVLEHREPPEQLLRLRREEVVAPGDRRLERPVALGQVMRTLGEERQTRAQAFEQDVRAEQLEARGGELEREREPVESQADAR